jgi:hypothetical protein
MEITWANPEFRRVVELAADTDSKVSHTIQTWTSSSQNYLGKL